MATPSTMWSLKRYARFHNEIPPDGQTSLTGRWQQYHGDDLSVVLHPDGQFVLKSETTAMESINLHNARNWLRGIAKGDGMLIECKLKNEARRFRMQFCDREGSQAVEVCRDFAEKMSRYFPVKIMPNEIRKQDAAADHCKEKPTETLQGDVTLSNIAKAVTREMDVEFPAAYQKCCNIPSDHLEFMLRLCLSDPTFPGFVEAVEQKLNKIKNNN